MLFRIIFSIGPALSALGSAMANITRVLIAAGLRRAAISGLWAAWLATLAGRVEAVARTRIAQQITIVNSCSFNLYDDIYEHAITFNYQSIQFFTVLKKTSEGLSQGAILNSAVHRVMQSAQGLQMINTVKQEKLTALQNLCSGLPAAAAAAVAFFLGTPPAEAEECPGIDTGFFIERVYGLAQTNAMAKFSPSGLWVLEPLQVDLTINIGTPSENMDPLIYREFLAWKNSLNVNQVLDEIEGQGASSGINYWSEITNQANAWVNGLNSGQIQPPGGISINGNVSFQNGQIIANNSTSAQINPGVAFKFLSINIGHIDKQTNVPVGPTFACDPYEYSCSPADMVLKSPFYNCKGFIVINNGTPGAFGFSMGNPDTSSSAPTLKSLLAPVVINGKLIQGPLGHFYTNDEQINGTNPFWINQNGSIQEKFFLCAA